MYPCRVISRYAPRYAAGLLLALLLLVPGVAAPAAERPGGAAIASAHALATEAGFEILEQGGNAFDAAVAVSALLAVVEPTSSGLGGGGFWLLHIAEGDRDVFLDSREVAPAEATKDMYLDGDGEVDRGLSVNGPLAAGIPGIPAGLAHLAENYGELALADSLAPAIRIAEQGFPAYPKLIELMQRRGQSTFERWGAAPRVFLPHGRIPEKGEIIRQPDLARTLRALAQRGRAGFYEGEVAAKLVEGVRGAGGIWKLDDLRNYEVVEREPVRFDYRGMQVISAPPPSSGGVALATMLNVLEGWDLDRLSSIQRRHLVIEAMRRAFRDRTIYLGDSDFVDVPVEVLTSEFYAAGLRASIRTDRLTPSDMLPGIESHPGAMNTTHFSIIDGAGNRVAATLSVAYYFGSAFMPPETGVILNNEMNDFSAKPGAPNIYGLTGDSANAIAPGKRPLSSMSPTFAVHGDRVAVLGTAAGSRIITAVLQGLLDFHAGNGPRSWASLPHYHHQYLPDEVICEPEACPPEIEEGLRALGHSVKHSENTWGNMHGVMWDRASGELDAASDPRWESGSGEVRVAEQASADSGR